MWRFLRNRRLLLCLHTIFRALIYWAHRAVVLAIAWRLVIIIVTVMMTNDASNCYVITRSKKAQTVCQQHVVLCLYLSLRMHRTVYISLSLTLLLVTSDLQEISQDIFIHTFNCVKSPCSHLSCL